MDYEMIGPSVAMRCVRAAIERFATCRTPLVLIGETGTGKSRLARLVGTFNPRADAPFVSIDGAAWGRAATLPPHPSSHGATGDMHYAWAAARGGTLFIDHIGETPTAQQAHLSQLLRGRNKASASPPRLIVANSRRLENAVALGAFDQALFARVHQSVIHLPALRHRPEDIADLADHFLQTMAARGGQVYHLAAATLVRLQGHMWPGNVRELHTILRRAVVLTGERRLLQPRDIVFDARGFAAQSGAALTRLRPEATH